VDRRRSQSGSETTAWLYFSPSLRPQAYIEETGACLHREVQPDTAKKFDDPDGIHMTMTAR
jgi:hypothetical protein